MFDIKWFWEIGESEWGLLGKMLKSLYRSFFFYKKLTEILENLKKTTKTVSCDSQNFQKSQGIKVFTVKFWLKLFKSWVTHERDEKAVD